MKPTVVSTVRWAYKCLKTYHIRYKSHSFNNADEVRVSTLVDSYKLYYNKHFIFIYEMFIIIYFII